MVPIIVLGFNRPRQLDALLSQLREYGANDIYVALDGPREGREDDSVNVNDCRLLVLRYGIPSNRQLIRQQNLGCRSAVLSALDWFFDQVEMGIVLEDDCLPSHSFLKYSSELLVRYKDVRRIFSIGGNNHCPDDWEGGASYRFTKHFHCWGWATWADRWNEIFRVRRDWTEEELKQLLSKSADGNGGYPGYWARAWKHATHARGAWAPEVYVRTLAGDAAGHKGRTMTQTEVDAWDYEVSVRASVVELLHVMPRQNLVRNVGFGEGATHTHGLKQDFATTAAELEFPLMHPTDLERSNRLDSLIDRKYYKIGVLRNAIRDFIDCHPALKKIYRAVRSR